MVKIKNKIFIGLGIAILVVGLFFLISIVILFKPTNDIDNKSPEKKSEMTKIILEQGRLAAFPNDIKDYTVQTEGSMFTRAFKAEFVSNPKALNQWILDSPGLVDSAIEEVDKNIKIYKIKTGEGAGMVNVQINFNESKVKIYLFWS